MPPSGNFLPPSGRIICGTGRQSHSKPTTTKITCIFAFRDIKSHYRSLTESEMEQRRLVDKPVLSKLAWKAVKQATMHVIPYPGGREEQSGTRLGEENDEQVQQEPSTKRRKLHNSLVNSRRSSSAIRHAVVVSAKNFIQQRLHDEQSDQVQAIIDVANAINETQLIASGRKLVEEIFGKESVQSFADDAVSYFVSHGAHSFTLIT